jgi:OOP family OmpA-OmpF porin
MISNNWLKTSSGNVYRDFPMKIFRLRSLMPTPSLTLWLCSSCVLALPATANTYPMTTADWYAGFNIGESRLSLDTSELEQAMQSQGFTLGPLSRNTNDTGFKIYTGAALNDYLALEGGYFNLGEVDFSTNTLAAGETPAYPLAGHLSAQGISLDLVARMFLSSAIAVSARLGLTYNDTDAPLNYPPPINLDSYNRSKHYLKQKFGAGIEYQFTPNFAMRVELERYRLDELWGDQGDFKLLSMGFVYQYDRPSTYSMPTQAPEPMAAAPQQTTPPAEPEEAVATPLRVELSDVHFAFNQAELTAETRAILAKHIAVLKQQPATQVQIAGYTSASGTESYNQQLSERRANAVKQYLMAEGGIDSSRLTDIGYGETDPAQVETTPSDLRSTAARANMRVLFLVIVK